MLKKLTPRELEVIELMSQGLSNKEIAQKLFIELCSLKSHIVQIYKKFNVQGIAKGGALRVQAILTYQREKKNIMD